MIGHQRPVNRWMANLSTAAERFANPCAVGMSRLVGIPPTVLKYEPRVLNSTDHSPQVRISSTECHRQQSTSTNLEY
ncbi:hypothetical protein AVEN_189431-1 [Araneus ventricosus]|uniref:Uncharacterized protein n=1 Tax=Araneus ventricosus TaxID=182803 RepID=A0A4Y2PTB8_ARAVE|nr:hypothetical protein AVEN_189431-1 [Araneus ventricosus]